MIYVALFLALGDLITTIVATRLLGPEIESNALYVYLIRRQGLLGFVLVYCSVISLLLYAGSRVNELLVGFVSVMAVIVVMNTIVLIRHFSTH
jgi:hypothetical protein